MDQKLNQKKEIWYALTPKIQENDTEKHHTKTISIKPT